MRLKHPFLMLSMLLLPLLGCSSEEKSGYLLNFPPELKLEVHVRIPGAREMALDEETGEVYVSSEGKVWVIRDGAAVEVMRGFRKTPGLAVASDWLFVSEPQRLLRYRLQDLRAGITDQPEVINESFPDETWHGSRSLTIGADGRIHAAMGVPCNICLPEDDADAILSMELDGSDRRVFARGIRNSVGMAVQPTTGVLYFTDNNVDNMGDDRPAGELNRAPEQGLHFGFPWHLGAGDVHEEFPTPPDGFEPVPPVHAFQAHVAALGLDFIDNDLFSDDWQGNLLVAQHGSWNRSAPVGYRVMRIQLDDAGAVTSAEVLIDGWLLSDGRAWGRPVDVLQHSDGSMLISDDRAGIIYRLTPR